MRKYNGLVIHQNHDDEGIIEVVEADGVRSLHFGSTPKQSSIRLSDENRLELIYAQSMMAWMLFKQNIEQVLIIGLGGGSLSKYLLHHFPECKLKAVEFRKAVIKIARSHFALPLDPRLKIIHGDGVKFIRNQALTQQEQYCLIMLDVFDHEGMVQSLCSEAFFDACQTLLKKDGILAINLWGTDKDQFSQVAWWLGRLFDWKLLFLPVKDRGNIIGFAFAKDVPILSLKELRKKAEQLEQQFQLDFPGFLKDIRKNNTSVLNRVIKK